MLGGRIYRHSRWGLLIVLLTLCAFCYGPAAMAQIPAPKRLIARGYDSGFELSNGTFNGMLAASDGKIYYVLCAENIDTGAQMYSYDPATDKIEHLGDLTEASGEKGLKSIPQGKSHVNFVESDGKLYFSTHVDWYSVQSGLELMAPPPPGYKPYPGGHFLAYDMASGKFENLAKAPKGQGIISMNMDTQRGRLYGLTWPSGYFLRYDLKSGELKNLGPLYRMERMAAGPVGFCAGRCRLIRRDGSVYFTNADGDILRYRYDRDAIETVQGDNLRKDYFGTWNPLAGDRHGIRLAAGGLVRSRKRDLRHTRPLRYLFRFDPRAERVDVLQSHCVRTLTAKRHVR